MDHEVVRTEFYKRRLAKCIDDGSEVGREQAEKIVVGDVAGGDDEESGWGSAQEVAIAEISVLAHNDAVLRVSTPGDLLVGGPVAVGEVGGVHYVMTSDCEMASEPNGKLGVDEQLHPARSGMTWRAPAVSAPYSNAAYTSSASRSA